MAQYLTPMQARNFEIDGKTYDLINLVQALESTPDGWVSPSSVSELTVGQIVHVWALGERLRQGVVAKLGRTKVTVVFTTQGAVDESVRYAAALGGVPKIRIADTAVQLSQIKIPAPAAPVVDEEPTEDPRQWATEGTEYPARKTAFPNDNRTPVQGEQVMTELTPAEWLVKSVTDEMAPETPVQTSDMTGSAVVKLMEDVWDRIRQNHPELPAVVIVTGAGLNGSNKWGHFRADGWKAQQGDALIYLHEMFMAGETLAKGARQVLQTMLHEGAHTLARVRDLKDTSRQGRWHNQTFRKMAEEMGLEHKSSSADPQHGFSFVTLTAKTEAEYADLLDELDREIRVVIDLPWFAQGTKTEGQPEGGEFISGGRQRKTEGASQSGNLKATCQCSEPNIIRASRKVLDLGVIRCDDCLYLFTAA